MCTWNLRAKKVPPKKNCLFETIFVRVQLIYHIDNAKNVFFIYVFFLITTGVLNISCSFRSACCFSPKNQVKLY